MLINPYVFGRLWTPADIATALWLDAADASTVTTVSGAVSQWNDKSGNGRNASQSSANNRPAYTSLGQNNLSVVTFDGSNDSLALGTNLDIKTAHSIFIAAKNAATITAATSTQVLLSSSAYIAPSTTTSELVISAGSTTGNFTNERLSSIVVANFTGSQIEVYGYGKTDADVSGGFILGSSFTTTGNAFAGRLNGSSDLTTASSVGGYSASSTRYPSEVRGIGHRFSNSTGYWNGSIWEIIILNTYASTDTTQRVEGYLAHKWGITANLPANHPYKSAAPTV